MLCLFHQSSFGWKKNKAVMFDEHRLVDEAVHRFTCEQHSLTAEHQTE